MEGKTTLIIVNATKYKAQAGHVSRKVNGINTKLSAQNVLSSDLSRNQYSIIKIEAAVGIELFWQPIPEGLKNNIDSRGHT